MFVTKKNRHLDSFAMLWKFDYLNFFYLETKNIFFLLMHTSKNFLKFFFYFVHLSLNYIWLGFHAERVEETATQSCKSFPVLEIVISVKVSRQPFNPLRPRAPLSAAKELQFMKS